MTTEAARHEQRLLPSGTAPLPDDRPARLTADSRYHHMARHFGLLAQATLTVLLRRVYVLIFIEHGTAGCT